MASDCPTNGDRTSPCCYCRSGNAPRVWSKTYGEFRHRSKSCPRRVSAMLPCYDQNAPERHEREWTTDAD